MRRCSGRGRQREGPLERLAHLDERLRGAALHPESLVVEVEEQVIDVDGPLIRPDHVGVGDRRPPPARLERLPAPRPHGGDDDRIALVLPAVAPHVGAGGAEPLVAPRPLLGVELPLDELRAPAPVRAERRERRVGPSLGQRPAHASAAFAPPSSSASTRVQRGDRLGQLLEGVCRQLLRLGRLAGLVERLLPEPPQPVELELSLLHLAELEAAEATLAGARRLARPAAVGVAAVAPLELREVRRRQRPALLGDRRDARPGVVDPDPLRRAALREEDDVGLHPGAVRREGPVRQAEHRGQVAAPGEDLEHRACLVGEQAMVRQDHRRPAARPQDRQHVLDEVELLVRGRDREILAARRLVRPLRAERRVRQDHIEPLVRRPGVDRVAERDPRLDPVEDQVHQGEPAGRATSSWPKNAPALIRRAASRSSAPRASASIHSQAATRKPPVPHAGSQREKPGFPCGSGLYTARSTGSGRGA